VSAPRSILVVDDEDDLRVTYERLLRRQGYRVRLAATRGAGLAIVETEPLTLVVTDLRLTDGSGLDVIAAARAAPEPAPAIVVTGFPSAENRQAALSAGASGFLAKPFSAAAFSDLVATVIAGQVC